MSIYAIGDLHFSGVPASKPMDVFGEHWKNHRQRVIENWKQIVAPEDTVILCGDISWAMKLQDAVAEDLQDIAELPGTKVMLRGNHDYWWTSLTKMKQATAGAFFFLQNNFYFISIDIRPLYWYLQVTSDDIMQECLVWWCSPTRAGEFLKISLRF